MTILNDLQMVQIPAGSFLMGSLRSEKGRYSDEGPQHKVTLESFFLGRYPITQAQWREVAQWVEGPGEAWGRELNPDPSCFKGDNLPVESVSWFDAMEFCSRLSQRTGQTYTLPSEAQWEYACRAGTNTPFYCGETLSHLDANYDLRHTYADGVKSKWNEKPTDVGSFPANPWGLYDMHGNVWEWCLDDWHPNYKKAPTDGSAWDGGLGKSSGAVPGTTSRCSAARPPAATASNPPMPSTSSVSVCVASPEGGSNSLGKSSGEVPGSAGPGPAAQSPASTAAPPLPSASSVSGCVASPEGGANSLGKSLGEVPGSAPRCPATQPPASTAAPPVPTSSSASGYTENEYLENVIRGGSWDDRPVHCRAAYRLYFHPANADSILGFRVCCSL